jgi:hypothetical protein
MLSNWTKATTTTTGTDTLTLSAVTGFPLPSDVFGVNSYVQYSLLDANGSKEAGIGQVAASNMLVRTRIVATWDGSTYSDVTPSALNLSAGTHQVFITPLTDGFFEPLAFPTTFAAAAASRNVSSCHLYGAPATTTLTLGTLYGVPFRLECAGVLTHMGVWVNTAGAGSQILVGLYDVKPDGHPGKLLATTGSPLDSTSTGLKMNAVAEQIRLKPGWYWTGLLALNGTAPQVHFGAPGNTPFGNGGTSPYSALSFVVIGSQTNIPDPFPALTSTGNWYSIANNSTAPKAFLRMS